MSVPIVSGPDRQRALDAALPLRLLRQRLCSEWSRGLSRGVETCSTGPEARRCVFDDAALVKAMDAPNRFAAGARYAVLVNTSRSFREAALDAEAALSAAALERS